MLKPSAAMKHQCATIMANGGGCFIGDKMYPNGTLEKEVFEYIGDVYQFVKKREEFCCDAQPVPYIGILNSASTLYNKGDGIISSEESRRALIPIRGAHKALVESNYHFNILNEETLLKTIDKYKTVILPDQSYLSKEVLDAIRNFVSLGGGLIASYCTSLRNEKGEQKEEFALSDLFGVSFKEEYPYSYAYIQATDESVKAKINDLPLLTHGPFLYVKQKKAQPLCALLHRLNPEESKEGFAFGSAPPGKDTGFPAVSLNQYGKGRVAYVSGEIFSAYWNDNQVHLKYLIKNLVDLVTSDKIIEVEAPPAVEVSFFQQGAKLILHFVNYHSENEYISNKINFSKRKSNCH